MLEFKVVPNPNPSGFVKHPKCLGYRIETMDGTDFDCEYDTKLLCDECKYGAGRKDPEAKCNQNT